MNGKGCVYMKKTDRSLYRVFASFSEWEAAVEKLAGTKEKGDAMELLVYFFLKSRSDYYNIKEIYMEDDIPGELRARFKLEAKDNGVDGVFVRNDGKVIAYQVKFRSGHAVPTAHELSTFWAESEYADGRLICANCASLPRVTGKKKNQMSLLLDTFNALDETFFKGFYAFLSGAAAVARKRFKPFDYQEELIAGIISGFETNDRGKFIAACGTGKTLVAMWVQEKMQAESVLFVVPSLSLIKQTMEAWYRHRNVDLSALCVCSDDTVGDICEDDICISSADVDFPVTTDPYEISSFLNKTAGKKVVFVTYNSLDAISNALFGTDFKFDIGIFDESHRTAGTKDSLMFVYGMDDEYIPIKKRLFMTATERLVSPALKSAAKAADRVIFSMDDTEKYGPIFAELNFGSAIEKDIICDYKIVVCTISEEDIADMVAHRNTIMAEIGESTADENAETLMKQMLIAKAVKELGIKKVITYHAYVKNARAFVNGTKGILPVGEVIDSLIEDTRNVTAYTDHINGTMSAGKRKEILNSFEKSERGLISNAKCLTEGVDVPAIDAVYFVDPKNSLIDIVQAVGRALRKSVSKKNDCAYILVPIVIPKDASLFGNLAPSAFDTLHNVIQAMRSQDHALAEIIDEINFSAVTGGLGKGPLSIPSKLVVLPYSKLNIKDFENSLVLRVAEVNKNPSIVGAHEWNESKPNARKSEVKRVFVSIGDYTLESYLESLIMPTLAKFTDMDAEMSGESLKVNNNNVSHAVRIGVLSKKNKMYSVTPLGREVAANKNIYASAAKEQLLKYHCQNKDTGDILFPYRAMLKLFLEFDHVTKFEFLYCIYSMRSTSERAVEEAAEKIRYLRATYPNLNILSDKNKEKILEILNVKYNVAYGYKDIWTCKTTTYNQFNYFKKHLWTFDTIFITKEAKTDKGKIQIDPGMQPAIRELLELTKDIENAAASGDTDAVEEMYQRRMYKI